MSNFDSKSLRFLVCFRLFELKNFHLAITLDFFDF